MNLLSAHGRVPLERGELELGIEVAAGDVVALVGPNGAGKTATLHALLGLHRLGSGQIDVDGRRVAGPGDHLPMHERGLGWAPQHPALLPRMRVHRQVGAFLRTTAPLADHGADGLLAALGIGDLAMTRPDDLSGGQAQRVGVARAIGSARCVLLDEPTSAQDTHGAAAVRALVRAHAEAGGAAIVVSHVAEDAYALADRLVVLERGQVVQAGRPVDLAMEPATAYVARAVGATVLHGVAGPDHIVRGSWGTLTVPDDVPAGAVTVTIRPGAVTLHRVRPAGSSRNVVRGNVVALATTSTGVTVRVDGAPPLVAALTRAAAHELDLRAGDEVWAAVKANDVVVLAGSTET